MCPDVRRIFTEVANQMRSDFKKAQEAAQQPGIRGEAFEETFRVFLKQYLPKSLDVSTGVLIDAHGNASRQLDVIISDSTKTPIFYRSGHIRVMPVECVYAVIEVKATLDEGELNKAFVNMESVRKLKKTAFHKSEESKGAIIYSKGLYGVEHEIWPINYYVFAYNSISLETLTKHIDEKHTANNYPAWSRIDTVCVLDKGVICNLHADGQFYALPNSESKLAICPSERSLLLFYTLITNYLNLTSLPYFRFKDYAVGMKLG